MAVELDDRVRRLEKEMGELRGLLAGRLDRLEQELIQTRDMLEAKTSQQFWQELRRGG